MGVKVNPWSLHDPSKMGWYTKNHSFSKDGDCTRNQRTRVGAYPSSALPRPQNRFSNCGEPGPPTAKCLDCPKGLYFSGPVCGYMGKSEATKKPTGCPKHAGTVTHWRFPPPASERGPTLFLFALQTFSDPHMPQETQGSGSTSQPMQGPGALITRGVASSCPR